MGLVVAFVEHPQGDRAARLAAMTVVGPVGARLVVLSHQGPDGALAFAAAEFCGGRVSSGRVRFSGGLVDFREAAAWQVPPQFPGLGIPVVWRSPCPGRRCRDGGLRLGVQRA